MYDGEVPARATTGTMTNIRWRMFGLLFVMIAINYIDRATLSVALPEISKEFSIPADMQGVLLSSFFWFYAIGQIPAGALADRYLPRSVISLAGILWGGFAALAALSNGWVMLLLTRVGLGAAEAPMYPAGAKLAGMWLTRTERGRGAALLDGGAPVGAAFGSLLIGAIMAATGSWRLGFAIAGIGTMVFGGLAYIVLRNHPWQHPAANLAERAHIQSALDAENAEIPAGTLRPTIASFFQKPGNWLLFLAWFCYNGQWYGALTWVPSYLYKTHGVNLASLGVFASLVFLAGFVGDLAGGFLLDWLIRTTGNIRRSYQLVFGVSSAIATACVFAVPFVQGLAAAVILLSASQFFLRFCGTYWTLPSLLTTPDRSGLLGGIMNAFGNLSGIVVPITVGIIVDTTGSYTLALLFFALMGVGLFTCSMLMKYRRDV
jgi:ACS family D-galactonate transporter-like MFS transporter